MMKDVERRRTEHESRFYPSPRHQIQVDYPHYMDEISKQFGVKPNLIKLFLSDPVLWYHVYFGPFLAYQYRINGPNSWSGARKAILTVEERIQAPYNTRKLNQPKCKTKSINFKLLIAGLLIILILSKFLMS